MIINTRPTALASHSNDLLEKSGQQFIHQPLTRIEGSLPSSDALSKLSNIGSYDAIIFTSQSAVKFGALYLKQYLPTNSDLPIIAIGVATKRALDEYGLNSNVPPNFNSAGIARLINTAKYERCLIFCGDKIPQLTQYTSSSLETFSCYRVLNEEPSQLDQITKNAGVIILIYNIQTLEVLVNNISNERLSQLRLVAASARIRDSAFKYGIKDCEIAEGPHDAEMIKTAIELASN